MKQSAISQALLLGVAGLADLSWSYPLLDEGGIRNYPRQSGSGTPIGSGDRFNGGTIAPQGLGTRSSGSSFSTILNVAEVQSGLEALANEYGFDIFTTPYQTFEGRTIAGGKVGGTGTCNNAYHTYLNANIHARERGGADGLLYFISDLLYANRTGSGLSYGSKSYTIAQVKAALTAGVVFVPMSNPDGVAYDQSSNSCWRKNRNTESSTTGIPASIGVDLNRNFDFAWDFSTVFAPSVQSTVASSSPRSEVFHGTSAFSEPETKSVKWIMDTFSSVRWFVDLHSYAGDILYSWGSDTDQSSYSTQTFSNSAYNSVRGILTDTPGLNGGYGEYTPEAEFDVNVEGAQRMAEAMSAVGGRSYTAMQAAELYPTSGASDDYSYSRHFSNTSLNLIHGYTIEFGFGSDLSCGFYPTVSQYNANLREIGAAFMELLLAAVELDLGDGGC